MILRRDVIGYFTDKVITLYASSMIIDEVKRHRPKVCVLFGPWHTAKVKTE